MTGRGPGRYFLAFYDVICDKCFSRGVGVVNSGLGTFVMVEDDSCIVLLDLRSGSPSVL